jgi:hypothetical protein
MGDRVRIRGLTSAKGRLFHGLVGKIARFAEGGERIGIKLADQSEPLAFKKENMSRI